MADSMLEVAEAPRRVFERIVLRRGSLRGLGQRCGRSTMWIWRQLRQNKGVDLVKTGKVLEQLEVPVRFFYEEILDQTPEYDPAWLLEHYREGNGIPRDPFLSAVHDRFLNLLSRPSVPGGNCHRREIDVLEEQRYFDRPRAKKGLEQIGLAILTSAEAALAPTRGQLADSSYLLLIWAAIQRAGGYRDDSVDAYRLGYRLAVAGRESKVLGVFFYFAANLLSELGQPAHGLRFAEQACLIFQQLRNRDLLAQSLVQNGSALYDLGRYAEARTKAIAALRVAPAQSWRTRVTAWMQLGNLALARGDVRAALGKMGRARRLDQGSSYVRAFIYWQEAAILGRLKRPVESSAAFQNAIKLFAKFGQPLDVAFVAVDLVEMLMNADLFSEALVMTRTMTPCFEKLANNAQASALWLDLVALILQGSRARSLAQVVQLREALADPKIRLQQMA